MNPMRNILGLDVRSLLPGVAAHLAHLSDEEQGTFFQIFANELVKACGTYHTAELQAAHINNKLTPEARKVFGMVGHEGQP